VAHRRFATAGRRHIETDIESGGVFEFRESKIVRWEDFGSRDKAPPGASASGAATGRTRSTIPGQLAEHRFEPVIFVDQRLEFRQALGDLPSNVVGY
jgi:hypothetical protein